MERKFCQVVEGSFIEWKLLYKDKAWHRAWYDTRFVGTKVPLSGDAYNEKRDCFGRAILIAALDMPRSGH